MVSVTAEMGHSRRNCFKTASRIAVASMNAERKYSSHVFARRAQESAIRAAIRYATVQPPYCLPMIGQRITGSHQILS
jgi:hypothetical protein